MKDVLPAYLASFQRTFVLKALCSNCFSGCYSVTAERLVSEAVTAQCLNMFSALFTPLLLYNALLSFLFPLLPLLRSNLVSNAGCRGCHWRRGRNVLYMAHGEDCCPEARPGQDRSEGRQFISAIGSLMMYF